jgi:uncharacterized protein
MSAVFADTSFFVAFINPAHEHHEAALDFRRSHDGQVVMTRWVLAELGSFLSATPARSLFVPLVRELSADRRTRIAGPEKRLFEQALDLYAQRADKHWSLADCTSFVVTRLRKLKQALTAAITSSRPASPRF